MLADMLSRVATEYTFERAKAFSGSNFADFMRHDLAMEAKKQLVLSPFDLKVKSSPGSGNWALIRGLVTAGPDASWSCLGLGSSVG